MRLRSTLLLVVAATASVLSGCSPYTLKGRVIAGEASYVAVVDPSDPLLREGAGLAGAQITLTTDPDRISRKEVGSAVSGPDGAFETPFSEVGGGFLQYDAGVRVSRSGYESAESFFPLPGRGKRLLVVLAPGRGSSGLEREDPYETYKRFKQD